MFDSIYRHLLLPPLRWATRNDPETAHDWFISAMQLVENRPAFQKILQGGHEHDPQLSQVLLDGITFPSPFGIAAGVDKNAAVIGALEAVMTPGFIEVGTVTPKPQSGNPRPRIFRVGKDNLINAMGFPNLGIEVALRQLQTKPALNIPIGLNIGKMKETSDADAPGEYANLISATKTLWETRKLPSFYVVNVSSPNTPGLTALQKVEPLNEILRAVSEQLDALSTPSLNLRHRLLIKIGPDLQASDIESIVQLILDYDLGGLVATNTTVTRPVSSRHDTTAGGFSGSALFDRAFWTIRQIAKLLPANKTLVAVGGIDTVDRAYQMLGYADLIGGYTGLVLKGPHLFRYLSAGILQRMAQTGVKSLFELRADQRA